ncbi:hypothetical protein BDR26DRAFT_932722 [Obelidium mucronatum]|nr:hypothetical protein BDR26DRAFT_932722 [Obelidium mucronatum]
MVSQITTTTPSPPAAVESSVPAPSLLGPILGGVGGFISLLALIACFTCYRRTLVRKSSPAPSRDTWSTSIESGFLQSAGNQPKRGSMISNPRVSGIRSIGGASQKDVTAVTKSWATGATVAHQQQQQQQKQYSATGNNFSSSNLANRSITPLPSNNANMVNKEVANNYSGGTGTSMNHRIDTSTLNGWNGANSISAESKVGAAVLLNDANHLDNNRSITLLQNQANDLERILKKKELYQRMSMFGSVYSTSSSVGSVDTNSVSTPHQADDSASTFSDIDSLHYKPPGRWTDLEEA